MEVENSDTNQEVFAREIFIFFAGQVRLAVARFHTDLLSVNIKVLIKHRNGNVY